MRIIVDVMGGDNAPLETVKGVCLAAEEFNASYILVGDKQEIERFAKQLRIQTVQYAAKHDKRPVE